ncbi:MAG: hypothetical protein QOJ22_587 [Thermoleophilaceae bacterium]|nr:hypothetical protein [Thermoleophilaceae bacterium]
MARIVLIGLLVFAVFVSPASPSEHLGDRDVSFLSLKVNGRGEALVSYRKAGGARRDVLIWGAVNAHAPDPARAQVKFRMDYTGGTRTHGSGYAGSFRNRCRAYDGPRLVMFVAGCKAPDGSYWALQRWQRLAPMRGFDPFLPEQAALELHVSHWSGPLPELEVSANWTYGGSLQGLFGRLVYRGEAVYGFRTPSATKSDPYARFVYIDTFNSVYGPGWKRDTAIVTHQRNGAFCYSFVAQVPPPGYPSREPRGPGNGERHRVTVMGPGVTPVVQWEGAGLHRYDVASDQAFNRLFDRLVGPEDRVCTRER